MGRLNGINQYKHGISRQYLFLDDDGRAYEVAARNEFREIAFEEALAPVETSLREVGATLETAYDDAYIERKTAALEALGIGLLRIQVVPEEAAD
ncbi:MAG: hypothetical protein K2X03_02575 [Bryobacteraceae bacterium]|nr:hypothetical protein [Bryobacteraceae bacterium]